MARNTWLTPGALAGVVVLGGWWWTSNGPGTVAIDLVERFPSALRRPTPDVFANQDITFAGVTRSSITMAQAGRITSTETLSKDGWLEVSLGCARSRGGDRVTACCSTLASRAGVYEELVSLVVNPFANAADRQWFPLQPDLSPYAGESVEIIFNTNAGAESTNTDNDLAVRGAPRVTAR